MEYKNGDKVRIISLPGIAEGTYYSDLKIGDIRTVYDMLDGMVRMNRPGTKYFVQQIGVDCVELVKDEQSEIAALKQEVERLKNENSIMRVALKELSSLNYSAGWGGAIVGHKIGIAKRALKQVK